MFRQLRLLTMLLLVVALVGSAGQAGLAAAATPPPPQVGPDGIIIPVPPPPLPDVFLHTTTGSNTLVHITGITHPDSNHKPGNLAFATHNWSALGAVGPYNNTALGTVYINNQWAVFNQNEVAMPIPLHFNVMIAPPSASVYTHTVTEDNTGTYITTLNQSLANNNPDALVFIMPRTINEYFNEPLGVYYRGSDDRWTVFSQDISEALPIGMHINVYVTQAGPRTFVHEAITGDNIIGNHTLIDHPLTNNNPSANIIVTQNYNPGGGAGVYNERHVGVFYQPLAGKWAIFNENQQGMPNGASFNVMVSKAKAFLPFLMR